MQLQRVPRNFFISKNLEIDHRDRNKANNSIHNLRLVTKKVNHENIEDRKSKVRLSKKDVQFIKESFSKWEGRKIEFYKLMAEKFGCVWQTIQYNLLGYSNKGEN
ncbi:HNH endonuclease [Sporosarcina globispora]|uniref:HNH endonuclease n=1 Tax=Sporosarcina globispora TaxID=1459 RepID=UPI0009E989EE